MTPKATLTYVMENDMNAINTIHNLTPDTLISNPVGTPVVSTVSITADAQAVWMSWVISAVLRNSFRRWPALR